MVNIYIGVGIPLIPKVDWGRATSNAKDGGLLKPITGTKSVIAAPKTVSQTTGGRPLSGKYLDSAFKGYSHASGPSRVPYDGYGARLHHNEAVLNSAVADKWRNGKGGRGITIEGGIHLHGVGGDLNKAADKLMDIMASKIQAAGHAGA